MTYDNQPDDVVDPHELWVSTVGEADFQTTVLSTAGTLGWKAHHHDTTAPSEVFYKWFNRKTKQWGYKRIHSRQIIGPGFPDLVLVNKIQKRTIFAELKIEDIKKGERSEKQIEWGDWLLASGAEYYLWRPSDLPDIERILESDEREGE